jgi:hypothetical protein
LIHLSGLDLETDGNVRSGKNKFATHSRAPLFAFSVKRCARAMRALTAMHRDRAQLALRAEALKQGTFTLCCVQRAARIDAKRKSADDARCSERKVR